MNDWNGNGSYDSSDRYIDYKLSGGSGSNNGSGNGGGGSVGGVFAYILAALLVGAICEPIGILMMVGLILGWFFGVVK